MDKIVFGMLNYMSINVGEWVLIDVKKLVDESIDFVFYGFKGCYFNFDFEVIWDYESD